MRTIGIIGAMDVEIRLIKERLEIIDEKTYAGFKFCICKFKSINIVLTACGVGKVNAASCTQILIDRFNVTEIINTGIAGGLYSKIKVCDIVISDNVTYHDVKQAQMKNLFPFKECFKANNHLKEIAIKAYENSMLNNYNYYVGRIVTGEAFVSDDKLKELIIRDYSPHCVEMEGAAIGHVADINDIPFIVIRSISDNADNDASFSYDEFEEKASNNSAILVLKMIELLNDDQVAAK